MSAGVTLSMTSRHIVTAGGHEIDLHYPQAGTIVLNDIAHHLAQINRFTGACRRPYSVAEHSLLVLEIAERLMSLDVHGRFAALMHDAHEAYTNDLATPAKAEVGDGWSQFEGRLQRTVLSAFGLHAATHTHAAHIKQADLIALATERGQLMPAGPGTSLWPCLVHVQPAPWVDLMSPERCAVTWAGWRDRFKATADALDYARNDALFSPARLAEPKL